MGLDQYAFASKRGVKKKEIGYWRKHPYLEQYMSDLYEDKTGDSDVFNCKIVKLDMEDLLQLRSLVQDNALPTGGGFFWGDDSSREYRDDDLEFCEKAMIYLNEGYNITYTSWW